METIREHFERAWKGVIAPNKYSYNINSVCPKEQIIDAHIIERIDLTISNDEGKNISAFIVK
jgi:hypothetical protein